MKKREVRGAGPSAGEIRLRGELDSLRRELSRLRKQPERSAGERRDARAPGAHVPAGAEAGTPAGGDATAGEAQEIERLRLQVSELTGAKQRLSRLYFTQLEENRRRQRRLGQLLETLRELAGEPDLDGWLGRTAESIRRGLGFEAVQVWVSEPDGGTLTSRAAAGVGPEAARTLAAADLLAALREEFRVGDSYFVSQGGRAAAAPAGLAAGERTGPALEWRDEDVLHVPLRAADGGLRACLTLRRPQDGLVPSQETVELLEIHGRIVGAALRLAELKAAAGRRPADAPPAAARRLQAHFASAVSREMLAPLAALRAHADALLAAGGAVADEDARRILEGMGEEARRLTRLVESVRDLGRGRSAGERVDLLEVAGEAARRLEDSAPGRDAAVKVVRDCADTLLVADRDLIRHLVLCMGGHAVRRVPQGGRVTIRVAGDDEEIVLEVTHDGDASPAGAPSPGASDDAGAADLDAARALVDLHDGRFDAASPGAGGGRLSARLPRRQRHRVVVRPGVEGACAADEDVLALGVEMVAGVMGARVVSILRPEPGGELAIHAAIGLEERVVSSARVRPGSGVAGWVAQHRRPVCVSGAEERSEITGSGRDLYRSRTFLSVPVLSGGDLLGVLNVTDPVADTQFGAADCQMLLQLADCIAGAWRRALAARRGLAEVDDTAAALHQVIRHVGTGHGPAPQRLQLATATGRELGLGEADLGTIAFAAAVHDIGMGGEEGLSAADTLKDIRRHPQAGADALRPLEVLSGVREIVLAHHEWWDGSGYPAGLRGEEIPAGARILAVVDAWESMTTGRQHRAPMGRAEAMAELRGNAGSQFDPRVVEAFATALDAVAPETSASSVRPDGPLAATRR